MTVGLVGCTTPLHFMGGASVAHSLMKKVCADVRDIGGCLLLLCLLYVTHVVLEMYLVSQNSKLNLDSTAPTSVENVKRALFYIKTISGHDNQIQNINSYYLFKDGVLDAAVRAYSPFIIAFPVHQISYSYLRGPNELVTPPGLSVCMGDGVISTTIYMLFGVQAGSAAVHHKDHYSRMKRWAFWAMNQTILTALLAVLVWKTNLNLLPICFTLISSAAFLLVFYILYMVTDIWHLWHDVPFYAVGRNALLVITGQMLCGDFMPLCSECFNLNFYHADCDNGPTALTFLSRPTLELLELD
ncbi:Heparan-alpha-glucosaminide N-acetyltransferase [Eumeta japonica]|uniref:Heparan-alpha-glucosaminide N-acetyltransferase n=1 Tax=Eumeta variegata TaxID=151549 RepID=A0A4C2A3W0_EUMVA|nr:Heparan-alpha-glucosaminide N-acetyltransferase [Eumeta japonica]